MVKIIEQGSKRMIPGRAGRTVLQQIAVIVIILTFLSLTVLHARPVKKSRKFFKEHAGLHGRVSSITRFYPLEFYDVSQNTNRDLSFEYLEITADNNQKRKMIYFGISEFILEDEICCLFKPIDGGSFLLSSLFEEADPARYILPLSHIRVGADGMIEKPPFSHCLLCSEEKMLIVFLEKGKGRCERWKDEEGLQYIRIEGDVKNFAEANAAEGCLKVEGNGGCRSLNYREY